MLHDMDLIEINHTVGCLSAELSLYECDIQEVSPSTLKKLSSFLSKSHYDFERDIRDGIKNKATEFYTQELYASLINYSDWYAENYNDPAPEETKEEAQKVFEQIEIIWRPLIEDMYPNFIEPGRDKDSNAENDPEGYNKTFGRPGEKYRSLRYDIKENPEYPHLTKDTIYSRLKIIAGRIPNEGADVSRLIGIAYKYGLLSCVPQRKSIIREFGLTCSEQSLTELSSISTNSISFSKRLKSMEEELLRK